MMNPMISPFGSCPLFGLVMITLSPSLKGQGFSALADSSAFDGPCFGVANASCNFSTSLSMPPILSSIWLFCSMIRSFWIVIASRSLIILVVGGPCITIAVN